MALTDQVIMHSELASPQSDAIVQIVDVSYTYPARGKVGPLQALRTTNLQLSKGEFFSVIGPSGCGKSTLLGLIGGIRTPSSGTVIVDGKTVKGAMPETTAIVFQEHCLFPWRTVQANVEAGLEFRGVGRRERVQKAKQYIRMVGLDGFADAYPSQLSGGMRQRASIARALCLETPVLLLDEPLAALDEQTRIVLGEEFSSIFTRTGKTALLVTHSLAEAIFLSDRVAVMTGRPGTIREIIDVPMPQPRSPDFMKTNLFHKLRDHTFELLHDEVRKLMMAPPSAKGEI